MLLRDRNVSVDYQIVHAFVFYHNLIMVVTVVTIIVTTTSDI